MAIVSENSATLEVEHSILGAFRAKLLMLTRVMFLVQFQNVDDRMIFSAPAACVSRGRFSAMVSMNAVTIETK